MKRINNKAPFAVPGTSEFTKPTFSRWESIAATTNSGKQQFICLCCGRTSVTPDKTCPKPAIVVLGGDAQKINCAVWEKSAIERRRM